MISDVKKRVLKIRFNQSNFNETNFFEIKTEFSNKVWNEIIENFRIFPLLNVSRKRMVTTRRFRPHFNQIKSCFWHIRATMVKLFLWKHSWADINGIQVHISTTRCVISMKMLVFYQTIGIDLKMNSFFITFEIMPLGSSFSSIEKYSSSLFLSHCELFKEGNDNYNQWFLNDVGASNDCFFDKKISSI